MNVCANIKCPDLLTLNTNTHSSNVVQKIFDSVGDAQAWAEENCKVNQKCPLLLVKNPDQNSQDRLVAMEVNVEQTSTNNAGSGGWTFGGILGNQGDSGLGNLFKGWAGAGGVGAGGSAGTSWWPSSWTWGLQKPSYTFSIWTPFNWARKFLKRGNNFFDSVNDYNMKNIEDASNRYHDVQKGFQDNVDQHVPWLSGVARSLNSAGSAVDSSNMNLARLGHSSFKKLHSLTKDTLDAVEPYLKPTSGAPAA